MRPRARVLPMTTVLRIVWAVIHIAALGLFSLGYPVFSGGRGHAASWINSVAIDVFRIIGTSVALLPEWLIAPDWMLASIQVAAPVHADQLCVAVGLFANYQAGSFALWLATSAARHAIAPPTATPLKPGVAAGLAPAELCPRLAARRSQRSRIRRRVLANPS